MNRRDFIEAGTFMFGCVVMSRQFVPLTIMAETISAPYALSGTLGGKKADMYWRRLPLTTKRMRELGVAGGDGFQYVQALAYAPSKPEIAYLSVDQSGVWRSDDGGRNWEPKFQGFFAYGARSIAVDPLNPLVVLAAGFLGVRAEDAAKYPRRCQGIFLTFDGGESWRMVRATDFYIQVSHGTLFAFDRNGPKNSEGNRTLGVWCASASEGLLKSMDGGESWEQTNFTDTSIHDMAFLPNGSSEILLATNNGLFHYSAGISKKVGQGLPTFPRSIAVSPDKPDKVYAALGLSGVAISLDRGNSFSLPKEQVPRFFSAIDVTDIAVSPVDGNRLYFRADQTSQPPYSSSDGGGSWHAPKAVDPEGFLGRADFYFSSAFAPHPIEPQTCLHVTTGRARIIRTEDGGETWHFSGSGFTGARMADILFLSDRHMLFGLTDHGLWESKDNGQTFSEIEIMRIRGAKNISAIAASGNNMVVGLGPWSGKGLAVSHDRGESFTAYTEFEEAFQFVAYHPVIPGLVYAGPLVSDDFGRNWRRLSETVHAMAPNGTALYSYRKNIGLGTQFLVSRDGGESFIPFGPAITVLPISTITYVVATALDVLFVATAKGVYRIQEGRAELKDHHHGLSKDHFENVYVDCLAFDQRKPHVIYAGRRSLGHGNGNGVFVSIDNGDTWQNANYNLTQGMTVFAVKVSPFDGGVFLGTSFGTFRLSRPETG